MTIKDSRLKSGVLTFGGGSGTPTIPVTAFTCQATNVHITPSYADSGDAVTTLCGDSLGVAKTESWALGGASIQDFDDAQGFLAFCFANRMRDVPFNWSPNLTGSPAWTGVVTLLALEEGGDVDVRLTSEWEFNVVGSPVRGVPGLNKSAPKKGDVFPSEPTITASDATNAAKLAGLGYVASPTTAWLTTQKMTIGTFLFNWSGTAWAAGAHA